MHILIKEAKHIRSRRKEKIEGFFLSKCIRVFWGRSYAIILLCFVNLVNSYFVWAIS